MTIPVFVDWVTIRQVFDGGLPVLNDGHVVSVNADGSVDWQTDRRMTAEGSFDSRCALRCDGNTVEFSGNIARYNRRDNLFGYDWDETIRRINVLTNLYGLPPFTKGNLHRWADKGWQWDGARVSRIDVTCNHACGSQEGLQAVIKAMAGHHVGRQKGALLPDGATIEYGRGSKYVYGKCYVKGLELERHRSRKSGAHVDQEVIDFCNRLGVLREEFTLKSRYLTQNGLCFLGAITHDALLEAYLHRTQFRRFGMVKYETFDDLPRYLQATYTSWKFGYPQKISRTTFWRHRKALLDFGIDIAVPSNVQTLPIRVKTVEVAMLEAPDWYRQRYG